MHSGNDAIPNYTKPYEQSGVTATPLALVPSSVHQPMSHLTTSDGFACNHLLGKRCTILNHYIPCSSIDHVNDNANPSKEQKLAMHINTRHMALYHPSPDVVHGTLAPEQSFPFHKPQSEPSVGGKQPKSSPEGNSMENAGIFTSKEMNISSENAIGNKYTWDTLEANVQSVNSSVFGQNNSTTPSNTNASTLSNGNIIASTSGEQVSANNNASSKTKPTFHTRQHRQNKPYNIFSLPSSISSKAKLPTFHSDHRINATASNSRTTMGYVGTRGPAQAKSLNGVQRWTNALRHICDVHKERLWCELFGDEPAFTKEAPDLLKLLKDIDQKKNQITYEEERAAGLITAITKVLETCNNSAGKESTILAGKILDNLLQRFQDTRFYGGSG